MEPLFRIVFSGDLAPGKRAQEIIEAFSARFQVSENRARDMILGGQRLVFKHDLDQRRADIYRAALEETGVLVEIEPQDPRPLVQLSVELPPSVDASHSLSYSQTPESGTFHSELLASQIVQEPDLNPSLYPLPSGARIGISEPARCPKCGAAAVSSINGICQSCGIVAERYLARQTAEREGGYVGNPYAPSRADLTPPKRPERGATPEPRAVPAGDAWRWIGEGLRAFREAPAPWIVAGLLYALLNAFSAAINAVAEAAGSTASVLIYVASALLSLAIAPIMTGGLMLGLESRRRGQGMGVGYVLAGFSAHPGRLALLGLTSLGLTILVLTLAGATAGLGSGLGTLVQSAGLGESGGAPGTPGPVMIAAPAAVAIAGLLGVAMMAAFAPALVAVNGRTVRQALLQSLEGCLRNALAGLVYWASMAALGVAMILGLGLAIGGVVMVARVLGLIGAILAVPVLIAGGLAFSGLMLAAMVGSHYAAYRAIFFGDSGD